MKTDHPATTDVLFVSERPLWPADQGFRVHGPQMARALRAMGLRVAMASVQPTPDDAPAWLRNMLVAWPRGEAEDVARCTAGWDGALSRLRHRLARRQGVERAMLAGLVALVGRLQPKAVIGLDQHAPMALSAIRAACPGAKRVWYAADEPASFQLSCLRREPVARWPDRLHRAAMHLLNERLFAPRLDAAIGVSPLDTALLRWLGGVPRVRTIRNGVDLNHYTPGEGAVVPRSLVFWGSMDFEPNVDAVRWFAGAVWPTLHERWPDATWRIVGRSPTEAVRRLTRQAGVEVTGAVADVRPFARSAAATVLPMRCGGGIKNKLLEAAAMGRPIVASPRAVRGLDAPPVVTCGSPAAWVRAIERVWQDPAHAATLGAQARRWVAQHHAWHGAAAELAALLKVGPATGRCNIESPGHVVRSTARQAA